MPPSHRRYTCHPRFQSTYQPCHSPLVPTGTGKTEGRSPKALEGFWAQSQLIQLNFANSLDPSAPLRKSIHLYILNQQVRGDSQSKSDHNRSTQSITIQACKSFKSSQFEFNLIGLCT